LIPLTTKRLKSNSPVSFKRELFKFKDGGTTSIEAVTFKGQHTDPVTNGKDILTILPGMGCD